ncbi:MAG TPA: hypothetical protein VHU21_15415, partial [Paraburkholderia sp.]|nr:hypothetical protein [Paraburkholderia sp.]
MKRLTARMHVTYRAKVPPKRRKTRILTLAGGFKTPRANRGCRRETPPASRLFTHQHHQLQILAMRGL